MNKKYYISNNFEFIQGFGNLVPSIESATHMSHADAQQFVSNHPDHKAIKLSKRKKSAYIVSTKQVFLGDDDKVVDSIDKAKVFSSPADAYAYMDSKIFTFTNLLEDPKVINENYQHVKRGCSIPQYKKLTKDSTGRITFTPKTKDVVAKNSSYTCAICGKPIYSHQDDFTIDHIVPLSRGGTNELKNLRATHKLCNTLKDNMTDEEMYSTVGDIVCHNIMNDPSSELGMRIIRTMVRGMINGSNCGLK